MYIFINNKWRYQIYKNTILYPLKYLKTAPKQKNNNTIIKNYLVVSTLKNKKIRLAHPPNYREKKKSCSKPPTR